MEAEQPTDWALVLGVLGLTLAWAWRPIWDIDLFWHVVVGRLILTEGIPTQDVLSAADPQAPWRTFQWGYEVGVAALDAWGGLAALKAAHAGLLALTLGLLTGLVRRAGAGRGLALGIVALALLLAEDRVRARPHLFELLFVVGLSPLLLDRCRRYTPLALLAVVVVWANLHAVSALWWFALVGAWAMGKPSKLRLGTWGAGVLLALSSGPARLGLTGAVLSHRSWPAELVPELQPTWAYAEQGWWGVVMLLGVGLGVAAAAHLALGRGMSRGARISAVGCAMASLAMARWAYLGALPLILWSLWRRPAWGWILAPLCVSLGLARVAGRWSLEDRMQALEPGRFPVAACEQLRAHGMQVPVDSTTEWTGYLLYCLYPGGRVLADGRLVFGEPVSQLLLDRAEGDVGTFDQAVGRYHTLALVWPTQRRAPLDSGRWRMVYGDSVAEVWLPIPSWRRWESAEAAASEP